MTSTTSTTSTADRARAMVYPLAFTYRILSIYLHRLGPPSPSTMVRGRACVAAIEAVYAAELAARALYPATPIG